MKTKQTGFTLVEIAIVLVIIGLLLGGILKGQEMIIQAKVKNSITDFSGVSAAFFGYQDRYRAIPGDDAAATRWAGAVVSTSAGDRVITGKYNATVDNPLTTATAESILWWDQLRRSGFVTGAGGSNPVNSFGGLLGVQTGNAASPIVAALDGFTNLIMCSTSLPDKVAIALDVQMDDGNPASGAVRGQTQTAANPDVALTAATTFVETGTTVYALCRQF